MKLKSENCEDYKTQIEHGYIPIELLYPREKIESFKEESLKTLYNTFEAKQHYIDAEKINFSNSCCFKLNWDESAKLNFAQSTKDFKDSDFKDFKPTLDNILKVLKGWGEEIPSSPIRLSSGNHAAATKSSHLSLEKSKTERVMETES